MSTAEQVSHFKRLKKISPGSLLFTVLDISDSETDSDTETAGSDTETAQLADTDTADESDLLPPTVLALISSLQSDGELVAGSVLQKILTYSATSQQCSVLEASSVAQSQSAVWAAHRIGRITASVAHTALVFDGVRIPHKTVSDIVNGTTSFTNEAIAWGIATRRRLLGCSPLSSVRRTTMSKSPQLDCLFAKIYSFSKLSRCPR